MLCHLTCLAGLVVPFGNILGPLIIWQIKRNEIPSTDAHGKASVNFQIAVAIALLLNVAVMLVLWFFCIGWVMIPVGLVIWFGGLTLGVINGIKANDGKECSYPWSIQFIN